MTQPKLWTKNFIAGTGINTLLVLNYYLLMIIMTEFAKGQYQISDSIAGLSASMFIIGALVARLFSAQLMERIGSKRLLVFAVLAEVVTSFLYFFAANVWILFLIRFIHGISYGMASTSVSTVVTGIIPEERHGEGIGYFMLSITLGAAIGPFLGMFLIGHGGYSYIFATCTLAAILCFIAALSFHGAKEPTKTTTKKAVAAEKSSFQIFEVKALPISTVCAGIYFCYSGIISFLTPYSAEIHLQTAATFFFVVYSFVILATRPLTGRLFDVKGARFVMLPAFFSFFIGMILLGCVQSGFMLLLSAAFLGFGVGVIQSSGLAIAVKNSPADRLSYVNSTFYIFIDIGTGIGPFLLGFITPVMGYRGMYLLMAIFTLLFCLLYLIVDKKMKEQSPCDNATPFPARQSTEIN